MDRRIVCILILMFTSFPLSIAFASDPLDNWNQRTTSVQGNLYAITFGNNMFAAVGNNSILTSSDGVQWTERYAGSPVTFSGVAFGNNIFVAVGSALDSGNTVESIYTSADGISWNKTGQQAFSGGAGEIRGITFGNNIFVAVGAYGSGDPRNSRILTSSDGMAWNYTTWGNGGLINVAYGNNLFVAVGESGLILNSYDGKYWVKRNSGVKQALGGIAFGNDIFVAVGEKGTILTSSNGKSWRKRRSGTTAPLYGIAWGDDAFVAVGTNTGGYDKNGAVLTSADGISWTAANAEASGLYGVAFGLRTFVAAGDGGGMIQSDIIYPVLTVSAGKSKGIVTSSDGRILCGNYCAGTYASNESVTLTATPVTGYILAGWSGDCSGTGTCSVTVDSNKTVGASFKIPAKYTLRVGVVNSGHGMVKSEDGDIKCGNGYRDCSQKPYYEGFGTKVILTATPDSGYMFYGWSGACSGTGTCTVTMDGNKTAKATFKRIL